jgi:sec-independent protein translocase protein TatA
MRALFEGPTGVIILLLVIVLFGAKRLPDAARSLGRSIRIFKSEMDTITTPEPKDSSADTNGDTKN